MFNGLYKHNISIYNGFVSSKIYDKCDYFDFVIVKCPFLNGNIQHYGLYISQLIRFARVCSYVDAFNARNKCLTSLDNRYHNLRKFFPS